ncbi:MAG TPA: group II intron reverse transcriptase/maturase [Coleofasciculaceae cyanobacterium]|jgi:RNA-directed DNA polymerase
MSKTSLKTTVEWRLINWRKLERRVYKLQKRIYRASQRGDVKAVRRLQKTLMKSWSARALAVRKVTQDNTGKKTAGVDGEKSLSPAARLKLVNKLKLGSKVSPTRRVWIPKPGREEKRPLGIPTMKDRTLQALVKLALEPEWEARFEPNSYGFRPGRSCHDAVAAIYLSIHNKSKYVLDADISKCFDKIDHEALLNKLNTFPTIRRQIRAWLKAGVMDNMQYFDTSEGTPQGGVISPLLANVALHGLEQWIKQAFPRRGYRKEGKYYTFSAPEVIRYADDFVILHEDISTVIRCRETVSEWLKGMGLELKPSKTRIAHTLRQYEQEKPGFEFLGFNIRQYPAGKYQSGKTTKGERLLGFKTIITPSKDKQKVHHQQVAKIIEAHKSAPQAALIKRLNPVIRGWANYYSTVCSKKSYAEQDHQMYQKLRAWARCRHPKKSKGWRVRKYWQSIEGNNWVFATRKEGTSPLRLLNHADTPIVRHVKVKGESSPYDANLVYWSTRMGNNPEMPIKVSKLLKRQKGKCAHCGLFFREDDVMEIDHKIPKSQGGKDSYDNWQLLHRHCHDTKTALDGSLGNKFGCNSVEPKLPRKLEMVHGK